jgi:hypothetical protein
VNAYAKINHRHPELFDEMAKAATPILETFNSQDLAIAANAYAKINHRYNPNSSSQYILGTAMNSRSSCCHQESEQLLQPSFNLQP